jgi:hypothetical protein
MNDQKKDMGKGGVEEKVTPRASDEVTIGETLKILMEAVRKLTDEVAALKKPVVSFGGNPVGMPPRADGINPGFDKNKGYVRQSRGYPVQEGQTWHDLTPAQRQEWFQRHENRWKQKYTQRAQGLGTAGMGEMGMGWTRG